MGSLPQPTASAPWEALRSLLTYGATLKRAYFLHSTHAAHGAPTLLTCQVEGDSQLCQIWRVS